MSYFVGTPLLFFQFYDLWPHQMGITCISSISSPEFSDKVSELSLGKSNDDSVSTVAEVVMAEENKEEFVMIGSHSIFVPLSKEPKSSLSEVKEMETLSVSDNFIFGSIDWIMVEAKKDKEDDKDKVTLADSFLADELFDNEAEIPKDNDVDAAHMNEALKKGSEVSIQGVDLEDDTEYQVIMGCNAMSVENDKNFIHDYRLKFREFELLVHHPIDYACAIKRALSFGEKRVLFFDLGSWIFSVSCLTIEEGFALPNGGGRPPDWHNSLGICSVQQLIDQTLRGTEDAKKLFEYLPMRNVNNKRVGVFLLPKPLIFAMRLSKERKDYMEDFVVKVPFQFLQALGCHVDAVCPSKKVGNTCPTAVHDFEEDQTYSEKPRHIFYVTTTFNDVDSSGYDALVILGGRSPEYLALNEPVIALLKHSIENKKPVESICHSQQILAATGVLKGRKYTAYPAVKLNVVLLGTTWLEPDPISHSCADTINNGMIIHFLDSVAFGSEHETKDHCFEPIPAIATDCTQDNLANVALATSNPNEKATDQLVSVCLLLAQKSPWL